MEVMVIGAEASKSEKFPKGESFFGRRRMRRVVVEV
jgi:hypothetical protein